MSIEIVNGRVFVEGKETVDPALIGYAVLDLAEDNQNATLHPITDKNLLSMINNHVELNFISQLVDNEVVRMPLFADGMNYEVPFYANWSGTHIIYNIVERIKNGSAVFKSEVQNSESTFTEHEIRQLQSKVHQISGDGEIMGLFNGLLGVCAG